jgi:membrane protein implicated in regulation of membrane protease activity
MGKLMEEKINYRYIFFLCLIVILTMVGSLLAVYVFFWAWSTYGVLFYAFLAIAILGLVAIFYLRESRKRRHAPLTRQ